MPRLLVPVSLPRLPLLTPRPPPSRTFISSRGLLAAEPKSTNPAGTSVNTGPGFEGRTSTDHAVNRTERLDPQADAAQSGMEQHQQQEKGEDPDSQGLSRRDEGGFNEKAQREYPEAPGPVLGMNDERGGVSDPAILPGGEEVEVEVEDRARG